jgi:hypothetical protein
MAEGIEVNDLGLGRIREQLAELSTMRITLGVQGLDAQEQHPNAKVSTGLLAFWLHFGTDKMLPVPYLDRAIVDLRKRIPALLKGTVSDLIDGRTQSALESLVKVGKIGSTAVQNAIDTANQWVGWDLSARTVNRKGHNRHLIETGTVRDAQSYAVRQGDRILNQGKAP